MPLFTLEPLFVLSADGLSADNVDLPAMKSKQIPKLNYELAALRKIPKYRIPEE